METETKNEKRELFENTPVFKALLSLSIPTIISQLINLIYSVADTIFIGRTGNPYMIAGVSLVFTLHMLNIPLSNLYGLGGGSLIARLMGRGEDHKARSVCSYSFWFAGIMAAAYSLLVFIFMRPILSLLGASEQTMIFARQYTLLVVVIGSIPSVLGAVASHLLRNTGYSKQASIGLSGGGILNIILDPLFMFVLFPSGMEVLAAAVATLLSSILSCAYLIFALRHYSKKAPLSVSLSDFRQIDKANRKEVYSVGVPSAVLNGLFDICAIVLNNRMANHGDLQLAAIGIAGKVERLPSAIGIGIAQGMMPLVAYNYASGNRRRMKEVIRKGRLLGLACAVVCIIFYLIFADGLCSVFLSTSSGAETAALTLGFAVVFLRIRCFASPLQFLNYASSFTLQAIGDGKDTFIHSFFRFIVFYIPLMFIGDALLGQNALAAAFPVAEGLGAILATILLNRRIRKEMA